MTLVEFNELCIRWHREDTGQRLGQWLMNHYPDDNEKIFYCVDKKEAAALFFNQYIITSVNGAANTVALYNAIPQPLD